MTADAQTEAPPRQKNPARGEIIKRTIERREQDVEKLEARVAELKSKEEEARVEFAHSAPATSTADRILPAMYAVGTRPLSIRSERENAEKKIASLRLELESLHVAYDQAALDGAKQLRDKLVVTASAFDRREQAAWEEFGAAYTEIVSRFNDVLEVVHDRDAYYQEIAWLNDADRQEIEGLFCTVQVPFPADLVNALILATDAAIDPRGRGREMAGYLAKVIPDLRRQVGDAKSIRGEKTGYRGDGPGMGFGSAQGGSALGFGGGSSTQGLAANG